LATAVVVSIHEPRSGPATRNLEEDMSRTKESRNKALVLEAFDTLFNKRDYVAAERYWSPDYIQHSAHIEPGRDGLFNLIKSVPATLKYEPGVIVADGDFVIVHGRFSGTAGQRAGSRRTSSASPMEFSSNTGTFFRTRLRKRNPGAVYPCSEPVSSSDAD
jgi:predicted SnoaL-like aldol condensation-catalyzing enzyme